MLPHIEAPYNKDLEEFTPFRYVNTDKSAIKIGEDYITFGLGK
jgi:hypothetical protein